MASRGVHFVPYIHRISLIMGIMSNGWPVRVNSKGTVWLLERCFVTRSRLYIARSSRSVLRILMMKIGFTKGLVLNTTPYRQILAHGHIDRHKKVYIYGFGSIERHQPSFVQLWVT